MKALVIVQHLLGTGHVVRAVAVARALTERGVDVTVVAGNTLPATLDTAGLRIEQLPAIKAADTRFSRLVTADGRKVDASIWAERTDRLGVLVDEIRPEILLTETFPLGRRAFARELLPTIERARALVPSILVTASVRDILVKKSDPAKERWMAEVAASHYDLVLVHADPSFVRLEASFRFAQEIADRIRYTGYVHTPSKLVPPGSDGDGEVIVSCGGGGVGQRLLEAAVTARSHARAATGSWRVLASPVHGEARIAALTEAASPGTLVEAARPDFPGLLKRAAVSVGQAGYNTVLDVIAAGCPAVLVPFAEGDETEQAQRATILAERGDAIMLAEDDITPERLAEAADAALALGPDRPALDIGGAATSAGILIEAAKRRTGGGRS